MTRVILHCDMNGFYAAVELLAHPELAGRPMAVSGDPNNRHGIILAKNQLAKEYGVVTAETIWKAKRKCPDLVLVKPHMDKYKLYCGKIRQHISTLYRYGRALQHRRIVAGRHRQSKSLWQRQTDSGYYQKNSKRRIQGVVSLFLPAYHTTRCWQRWEVNTKNPTPLPS